MSSINVWYSCRAISANGMVVKKSSRCTSRERLCSMLSALAPTRASSLPMLKKRRHDTERTRFLYQCTDCALAVKPKTLGLDGFDLDWYLDALRSDGSVLYSASMGVTLVDLVERIYT